MKSAALWAALLFAGSPVVAQICVLRCAGLSERSVASAPHSHCGERSPTPPDGKRNPCGHGHREQTLLSSAAASKVAPLPAADFAPDDCRAAVLDVTDNPTASPVAFESPPRRSFPSVLRL